MYTVGEMARMLHVPASTLRYYDKQGLLPFVERSPGGIRVFKDSDFEWLRIIECMKKAGMSLKDIRIYIELAMQGDSTIDARLAMFRRQQDTLRAQMQQLQDTMQVLEYKCWYYETAQKLGSIDAVKNLPHAGLLPLPRGWRSCCAAKALCNSRCRTTAAGLPSCQCTRPASNGSATGGTDNPPPPASSAPQWGYCTACNRPCR